MPKLTNEEIVAGVTQVVDAADRGARCAKELNDGAQERFEMVSLVFQSVREFAEGKSTLAELLEIFGPEYYYGKSDVEPTTTSPVTVA